MNRRAFLQASALTAVGAATAAKPRRPHIATNTYPWGTFAKREGRDFVQHTDDLLAAIASTGITGYEPNIKTPTEFDGLGGRLEGHGLEMRSIYVNSLLHDAKEAKASIASVLEVAAKAVEIGV